MGITSKLVIKESLKDLELLHKKEKNSRSKLRLKSLIYTKSKKFKTQTVLATHLGIDYSTLKRWFKKYTDQGLESFLDLKLGGNKKSIIPLEIHQKLEQKIKDKNNPLRGYWDAQQWVKSNFNLDIQYNTLRTYLIRHFKTKIKTPRKSHYKKSEEGIEVFLKTSK